MEKCSYCEKESYSNLNGNPICVYHYIKDYWLKNKGCLFVHLDSMIDIDINSRTKLFLEELQKQYPEIVDEYPILYKSNDD